VILRPYQREFVRMARQSRRALWLGPRQVGKDFVLGYMAQRLALETRADVLCANKDQRQSTKFLRVVDHHLRSAQRAGLGIRDPSSGNKLETRVMLDDGTTRTIHSLPGNPDALQGFTGPVVLNELGASRHDPDEIMAQAESVISSRPDFRLVAATNATRRGTWLHRFVEGSDDRAVRRRSRWTIYRTTIHDVYPDGLPPHIEEIRDTMTRAAWGRWYLAEFTDAGDGTFNLADRRDPVLTGSAGVRLMAVDIGATRHPSALVVVEQIGDGWRVIAEDVWWGMPLGEQPSRIASVATQLGVRTVYADHGGVGKGVVQDLQALLGAERVIGSSVSQQTRDTGAELLLTLLPRLQLGDGVTRDHLAEITGEPADGVHLPEVHPHGERLHHCDAADALLMLAPAMARRQRSRSVVMPSEHRRRVYQGM
jgi:hypothetical protein